MVETDIHFDDDMGLGKAHKAVTSTTWRYYRLPIMSNLYRVVQVWCRTDAFTSIRYSCLENLVDGSFRVLLADFIRLPFKPAVLEFQDRNVAELLAESETSPETE